MQEVAQLRAAKASLKAQLIIAHGELLHSRGALEVRQANIHVHEDAGFTK
jgi:hypothetical protein